MQPYEFLKEHYKLPVELYPFQQDAMNKLAPLERAGYYLDVGTGKTFTSISAVLFKLASGEISNIICLMPPVLLTNWSRNLAKIPDVTHVVYRGSPGQRKQMNLNKHFILMSYQIFKKDWERLQGLFMDTTIALLCDEATAVKNIASDTHKKVRDFAVGNHLLLLSGTPLSSPLDAYAYTKLVAPGIYRNLLQFENIHVEERDFFKKPTKWGNIELLRQNMEVNSVRVLKEDVLKDLPPITYTELYYDLDKDHLKLYQELASKQLKVLEDGSKIDMTSVSALFHALQQIPANAEYFSGDTIKSTVFELIDEIMDELGDGKLVIFSKYKLTNRRLLDTCQKYGVKALFSDVTAKQQQLALDTFINDPACRMLVLQHQSGGYGIDGLQDVCYNVLFIELPHTAAAFTQAVARVHRGGQRMNVNVRVALAEKTIQTYIWSVVQEKDALVNLCIRGPKDLRDAVNGVVNQY